MSRPVRPDAGRPQAPTPGRPPVRPRPPAARDRRGAARRSVLAVASVWPPRRPARRRRWTGRCSASGTVAGDRRAGDRGGPRCGGRGRRRAAAAGRGRHRRGGRPGARRCPGSRAVDGRPALAGHARGRRHRAAAGGAGDRRRRLLARRRARRGRSTGAAAARELPPARARHAAARTTRPRRPRCAVVGARCRRPSGPGRRGAAPVAVRHGQRWRSPTAARCCWGRRADSADEGAPCCPLLSRPGRATTSPTPIGASLTTE